MSFRKSFWSSFCCVVLTLFAATAIARASGTDVEFRAVVSAINQSGPGVGTLIVDLLGNDVPVIVNVDTEIEFEGDEDDISSLSIGDFVEIHGFFSASGIVAEEVDVLEGSSEQFRFIGTISARAADGDDVRITLLGVEVFAGAWTRIDGRGVGSSNDVSLDDLQVGTRVDVRGRFLDGVFRAGRVHIGVRDPGRVEFDGRIVSFSDDILIVDTLGGGHAVVSIVESTEVRGILTPGKFVEVEGFLDAQLVVVADEIKVDSNDDGDADDDAEDDDSRGEERVEVSAEIPLRAVGSNGGLEGKAEFKFKEENGSAQQEFEVEIEDGVSAAVYRIVVVFPDGSVDFGTMTTNALGDAEAEFDTSPNAEEIDLTPLLPSGRDVRNIVGVQITRNGTVVLEGSFQ